MLLGAHLLPGANRDLLEIPSDTAAKCVLCVACQLAYSPGEVMAAAMPCFTTLSVEAVLPLALHIQSELHSMLCTHDFVLCSLICVP